MSRDDRHPVTRRDVLKASAGAAAALTVGGCVIPLANDRGLRGEAAILRADYGDGLVSAIESGFALIPPPDVSGKRVVLKPNLVDLPREGRPATTNPAVIVAVAEALRRRGAAEIIVGDGPALQRDAWQIADAIGLTPLIRQNNLKFVDLNLAEMTRVPNRGGGMPYDTFYFSKVAVEADVFISVAKLKTHHWAGASLTMKNMFGVASCAAYGWPRNIFHLKGLHPAVLDFNLSRPIDYAVIDGVVGMEGDGPVRGTPIDVGVVIMGSNPAAVDATGARVMGLTPERIDHMRQAAGIVGPILESSIEQRGETIASVRQRFAVMPNQAGIIL